MKTVHSFMHLLGAALVAVLAFAPIASAQTSLNATTLSSAISDSTAQVMVVASATGFTAPGSGGTAVDALIDREVVAVRTVSSTTIGIMRGQNGTRAVPHASGATVTVGAPRAFHGSIPSGTCTRTNLEFVPYLVGGGAALGSEVGSAWDCLGSQWIATNMPVGPTLLGSTVASATTIAATGTYFKVSGTTAVATITLPSGWAAGMCLQLEPTGLWSTTTAGNILLATTGVVSKVLTECWNGTKWAPSY